MKLNIKILNIDDVSQAYVDWFSNADVVLYSDNQFRSITLDGQRAYVNACINDSNVDLYGIFDDTSHIGNIAITGLNSIHKWAELTYVVGETKYWGQGVGNFAVSALIEISRQKYQLNKLCAGLAENNIGSRKVLEKNGFILEGTRQKHLFYNDRFYNQLDYGLVL